MPSSDLQLVLETRKGPGCGVDDPRSSPTHYNILCRQHFINPPPSWHPPGTKRLQDAEQRSAELLGKLQALEGEAGAGAQLLEQATARGSAGEVALVDARREVERLERALQDAQAERGTGVPNGHASEGRPLEDMAIEMEECGDRSGKVEQLRSENETLKKRLAAANRRSSSSGQSQASLQAFHL